MTGRPGPGADPAGLTVATAEEIAETRSHALCDDERGKPGRGGGKLTAGLKGVA